MKSFILLIIVILISPWLHAQVAINTDGTSPDNSAMLDVKSTDKGVLFPRMTSAEREAIAFPATGLTVYDLTTQSYWYYNGTIWVTIGIGPWTTNGDDIYSNISGNAAIGTSLPQDKLHLFDSANLRLMIETPDNYYAGIRTRNSHREYFMGTIDDRWAVFDNYVYAERISVLPDGNIGIGTTTPSSSAALEIASGSQGFLPPRMTTAQRNSIVSPAEGLVLYNTDEKALNFYNGSAWTPLLPAPAFECGYTITVNHSLSRGVAPVSKTVTYGTVNSIPGEPAKCWITSNLGANHQATAVDDATEASAGWYWQFNRKQGFKHDGTTRTPNTTWITPINENLEWEASNDPCTLELGAGWHLPTNTEWNNVNASGGWTTWTGPWNSGLKMHAAGYLTNSGGSLYSRGTSGFYWGNAQGSATNGWNLFFSVGNSSMNGSPKASGFPLRCLKDQVN